MTEKRSSRFLRGLLIYILAFLLLAGAVLLVFDLWLRAFEATRPETAMRIWYAQLLEQGTDEACAAALSSVDEQIQSREESEAFIAALLRKGDYREDVGRGGEDTHVYTIRSDGQILGRVTLRPDGHTRFGMNEWAVAEEEFDFSPYFGSATVTVPPNYSVWLDDVRLDESYISDPAVPYAELSQFEGVLEGLPVLYRYDSGRYLGQTELRVLDAAGNPVSPEDRNELFYLDNCDDETQAALTEFAVDYIQRYVLFTANIEQSYESGYSNLAWLVVPGSSLSIRLQRAVLDGWRSNAISCKLSGPEIRLISDLGDNGYLVDLSYETNTSTMYATVEDSYQVRLLVTEYNGRLRAYAMYYY